MAVVKKKRHEVQFEPGLEQVLKQLAEDSHRSLKEMLEILAIDYAEKQTGEKFTNKIKKDATYKKPRRNKA